MIVGRIKELWRYPVKSMAGERIDRAQLGTWGVPGDRGWAVRDEQRGAICGAKKIAGLMRCSARYPTEPTAQQTGEAEITLPDGARVLSGARDANARLSAALGRDVTLWPLLPADRVDHYRRGFDHTNMEHELRAIFGLQPDEPLPDLSGLPPELMEFESPPGTYLDAFPLHMVTDASLARLQALAPDSRIDVRRFRPNVLIEMGESRQAFVEPDWAGKQLKIGGAVIEIAMPCPRCVMTTRAFADLPEDPAIMRTLVREAGQNLGVYATVAQTGPIATGDAVELLG